MPAAITFDSLKTTVASYVERGSIADEAVYDSLPLLINNAERNIQTELNVTGVRAVSAAAMTTGAAVLVKPELWRRTTSINIGTGSGLDQRTFLYPRSYEYCRAFWPDDTVTDQPKFYADYDDEHFLITPTPAADYPFEIVYFAKPLLLDDTNQTNWLTENWPQLLLYATLRELAPFLKGDDRLPVWEGMYSKLISSIAGDDTKKIIDRAASRQEA